MSAIVALYATNSGRGATVNIRRDLIVDMQECSGKIVEHREKVKDYEAWTQVLASQGEKSLALHQDDWLFFFGK